MDVAALYKERFLLHVGVDGSVDSPAPSPTGTPPASRVVRETWLHAVLQSTHS